MFGAYVMHSRPPQYGITSGRREPSIAGADSGTHARTPIAEYACPGESVETAILCARDPAVEARAMTSCLRR